MSDLIRREDVNDLIKQICDACGEDKKNNGVMCGACNLDSFIREFDDIPSAEPERTVKAVDTWKVAGSDELNAWCPECEHRITRGCSYCPTCGVKLDWSE